MGTLQFAANIVSHMMIKKNLLWAQCCTYSSRKSCRRLVNSTPAGLTNLIHNELFDSKIQTNIIHQIWYRTAAQQKTKSDAKRKTYSKRMIRDYEIFPEETLHDEDIDTVNLEKSTKRIGLTQAEQSKLLKSKPCQPPDAKILKVAILGAPNVGKSTLANQLLGRRYSAVSKKVHTTRYKSIGVLTEGNTQIVILDTPGIISPKHRDKHKLNRSLLVDPYASLYEADTIIVLVDVSHVWHRSRLPLEVRTVLELHRNKHILLVQNKTDLYSYKPNLLHTARKLTRGCLAGKKDWYTRVDERPAKKKKEQKVDFNRLFNRAEKKAEQEAEKQGEINKESMTELQKLFDKVEAKAESTNIELGVVENGKEQKDEHVNEFNLNKEQGWVDYYHKKIKATQREVENHDGFNGFHRIFHISAIDKNSVSSLKDYLIQQAKPGEWQYSEEVITNLSSLQLAKMCIFEKLLDNLPDRVPYKIDIQQKLWHIEESGLIRSQFVLHCSKQREFISLLAVKGEVLKKIAREAKQELMNTFQCEMTFSLQVELDKSAQTDSFKERFNTGDE